MPPSVVASSASIRIDTCRARRKRPPSGTKTGDHHGLEFAARGRKSAQEGPGLNLGRVENGAGRSCAGNSQS